MIILPWCSLIVELPLTFVSVLVAIYLFVKSSRSEFEYPDEIRDRATLNLAMSLGVAILGLLYWGTILWDRSQG